jgi:mRNA-degrading endonuclease HigB of HigAB toxin-antitoxin module
MCIRNLVNNTGYPFHSLKFSFIDKVKNGSCVHSNEIFNPYKKCGAEIMDYTRDVVPYVVFLDKDELIVMCYSFEQNVFFFIDDFTNRILFPIAAYSYQMFIFVYFTLFSLLIIFIMIPSEYDQLFQIKLRNTFWDKFRFIFSLKNQIIFLSLMSAMVPAIIGFISNFVKNSIHTYGIIAAQILTFVQFFHIITLWFDNH